MREFDVVVLGLGAMGSAAAYHLAKRRARVLGIDRHSPPHAHGSSHGDTRITRLAIGEGAHYTPLAVRSHALWRELERESGASLLRCCGGLVISSPARGSSLHGEDFFANTIAAARQHGIAHEILDAAQIRRRFPPFAVADDEVGYYEPDAGFLRPEACIRAHLAVAERQGAAIHRDERVAGFDASERGVTVTTDRATYAAQRLIVAAGAWLPGLVDRALARHFAVYRQRLFWFDVADAHARFVPERFPVFIWEVQRGPQGIYGFPAVDGPRGGIKVATEQYAATTTAEAVDPAIAPEEAAEMYRTLVAPYLCGVGASCVKAASCLYTVTRDFGFVIDRHPASERVLIVSACSGHGFKHSAAIGEAAAELAVGGASRLDLGAFALRRFEL
jgi:sarcosine oxidase